MPGSRLDLHLQSPPFALKFRGIIVKCVSRHHQTEIPVSWQLDDADDDPADYGHVLLPVLVSHIIDEDSPLYNLGPTELARAK